MNDLVLELNGKTYGFRPVKGRKALHFAGFMTSIAGNVLMKKIKKGNILDQEITSDDLKTVFENITDDNIDTLLDKYLRKFVVRPNWSLDESFEAFLDSIELTEMIQLLVSFVMMAFTGSFPENEEVLEK